MQVYSTGSFSEGPLPCAVHAVYSMTLYASLCTFRTHVVVAFRCSCCVYRTLHDYGLCQSDYRYSTMCYVNVAGVVSVCCRVRSRVGAECTSTNAQCSNYKRKRRGSVLPEGWDGSGITDMHTIWRRAASATREPREPNYELNKPMTA